MNGKSRLGIKGRLERLIFYSPDGCWLWIGQFRKEDGYGLIKIDKRLTRVHRVAWAWAYLLKKGEGLTRLHVEKARMKIQEYENKQQYQPHEAPVSKG